MKKKILVVFMTIFMFLALGCGGAFIYIDSGIYQNAVNPGDIIEVPGGGEDSGGGSISTSGNWTDYAASSFAGGNGTESYPYQIATASQLAYMAKLINSGTGTSNYYTLTSNIDLDDHYWTPIGNGAYSFEGKFYGNGHSISGVEISINRPYCVGLFGFAGGDFLIENLYVSGSIEIGGTDTLYSASGGYTSCIGGLIGRAFGSGVIANVENSGLLINIKREDSKYPALVGDIYVGGIAGLIENGVVIRDSVNSGGWIKSTTSESAKKNGNAHIKYRIGGIVGAVKDSNKHVAYLADNLIRCQFNSSISLVEPGSKKDCHTYDFLSVGGIVGDCEGGIKYCASNGLIKIDGYFVVSSYIYNNYSTNSNWSGVTDILDFINVGGVAGVLRGGVDENNTSSDPSLCAVMYACANYSSIDMTNFLQNSKYGYVGGLVARTDGTYSVRDGNWSFRAGSCAIKESANFGDIIGNSVYYSGQDYTVYCAGGILGMAYIETDIENCANYGDVRGIKNGNSYINYSFYIAGGILGVDKTAKKISYSDKEYLYTYQKVTITKCINHGLINTIQPSGILGLADSYHSNVDSLRISFCCNMTDVIKSNFTGYSPYLIAKFGGSSSDVQYVLSNNVTIDSSSIDATNFDSTENFLKNSNTTKKTDYLGNGISSFQNFQDMSYSCSYNSPNGFTWFYSPIVGEYFTENQRIEKGMGKLGKNYMIPSALVKTYLIYVNWRKNGESYTTIENYAQNSLPGIETQAKKTDVEGDGSVYCNKTIWQNTNNAYALKGLEYTSASIIRSENDETKFKLDNITVDNKNVSSSYTTNNSVIYTYPYLPSYLDSAPANMNFYFSSVETELKTIVYLGEEDVTNENLCDVDILVNGSNSKVCCYKDSVQVAVNPNFGYRVTAIGAFGNNSSQSSDSFDNIYGKQGWDFEYNFETVIKIYLAYVKFTVKVTGAKSYTAEIQINNSDYAGLELDIGYTYTFEVSQEGINNYTEEQNTKNYGIITSTAYKDKEILLEDVTVDKNKKILFNWSDVFNVIKVATSADKNYLKSNEIFIDISKSSISYNVQVLECYDSYNNFGESENHLYTAGTLGGTASFDLNKTFNVESENSIKNNITITNNAGYQNTMLYYFDGEKSGNYVLPEVNKIDVAQFDDLIKDFIETYCVPADANSFYDKTKTTIYIYVPFNLQSFAFTGEVEGNGNIAKSNLLASDDVDISFDAKGKGVGKNIKYFTPITLTASEADGLNFVGFYLTGRTKKTESKNYNELLTKDKTYNFFVNPSEDMTALTITARYVNYNNGGTIKGTAPTRNSAGDYEISSVDNLLWLSSQVANGTSFEGQTFVQTCDIDLSSVSNFVPIGFGSHAFSGTYNGNGYKIKNLESTKFIGGSSYINSLSGVGLFGYTNGATIKNVVLDNVSVAGYSNVGILVGKVENTTLTNNNILSTCSMKLSDLDYYDIYGNKVTSTTLSYYVKGNNPQELKDAGAESISNAFDYSRVGFGVVGNATTSSIFAISSRVGIFVKADNQTNVYSNFAGIVGTCDDNTTISQSFVEANGHTENKEWVAPVNIIANGGTILNCYSNIDDHFDSFDADTTDTKIWITVNGKTTLKVFYWA